MMHDITSGGIILTALLAMLIIFSYAQRHWGIHPEITRKSVHIGMGLVTLSFPRIFDDAMPVVVLAGIAVVSLVLIRSVSFIKAQAGSALGEVQRASYGEIFFPIGVAIVFVLAEGDTLLYVVPVLILTFADALAALVGHFGGRLFFTTPDGRKTLEGSTAFLLMSMLCIGVPLQYFSSLTVTTVVAIALLLGLLVMLFEAVSWAGIDNLLIPILSFLLLRKYISMGDADIPLHLIVLLVLIVVLPFWQRYSSLRHEAVLTATLFGYFSWAIGGTQWLVIAFVMMVSYPFLTPGRETLGVRHGIGVIFHVAGSGALWLVLAQRWDAATVFYLYSLSFASHLALICLARHKAVAPNQHNARLGFTNALKAAVVIFIPYLFIAGLENERLLLVVTGFIQIAILNLLFTWSRPDLEEYHRHVGNARWYWQTGAVLLSCGLAFFPYLFIMERQ